MSSSLTQTFPSDTEPSESASALQAKCTALAQLHQQATNELTAKDSEINQLRIKHAEYVNTSRITISDLTKTNTELARNLRWAEQGRDQAERREALIRKELEQDGPMVRTRHRIFQGIVNVDLAGFLVTLDAWRSWIWVG